MNKQESDELKHMQKLYDNPDINHWVKDYGVRCHIFTIQIVPETDLADIWEDFTNTIAGNFQTDFEDEYESWNVYVVFLAEFEIDRALKYKIENDKYSSRKIVMDEISPPIDNDKIVELISKRIFQLDIGPDAPHKNLQQQDLSEIIDKSLYSHIKSKNLQGQTRPVLEMREQIFKDIYEEYSNEI